MVSPPLPALLPAGREVLQAGGDISLINHRLCRQASPRGYFLTEVGVIKHENAEADQVWLG